MEMVSITPLCVASLLATCNPSMTEIATTEGDSVQQSTDYDSVDSEQITQWVNELTTTLRSNPREAVTLEVVEYLVGYKEYQEEQERLAELERQRIAEEQARLEEQRRQEELARIERERIANEFPNTGFRQTYYSVQEGEVRLGSGLYYGHPRVKNINNVMYYNDEEYGWLPIYAINMDEVVASGQNNKGTWNIYGSVIELKSGNTSWLGYVGDACGACQRHDRVDLWVYSNESRLDVSNIDWKYVRRSY